MKYFLILLILGVLLLHSLFFETLGFSLDLQISGNYEFAKTTFFHLLSPLIFAYFFLQKFFKKEPIHIPKYFWIIFVVLFFSQITSIAPFYSWYGNDEKTLGTLTLIGLSGIFLLFYNLKKTEQKYLGKIFLYGMFFVQLYALKEYFFPSFSYGEIGERIFGSTGHPNNLAFLLVASLPFLKYFFQQTRYIFEKYFFAFLFFLTLFSLFFTKSFWGMGLAGIYILVIFLQKYILWKKLNKKIIFILLLGFFSVLAIIAFKFFPHKLGSFVSRFYIWESVFQLFISSPEKIFFGFGLETLGLTFQQEKSPYLYIFENFGYSADRPHNIFLYIFYHFGLLGISAFLFFFVELFQYFSSIKNISNFEKKSLQAFFLGIFFLFFHPVFFLGIFFLLFFLSFSSSKQSSFLVTYQRLGNFFTLGIIFFFGIFSCFSYANFFLAEVAYKKGNIQEAKNIFSFPKYFFHSGEILTAKNIEKFPSENFYKSQIFSLQEIEKNCSLLTEKFFVAENFFLCGKLFENVGNKELSLFYYQAGLKQLPDLWNTDSPYWNNFFVRHSGITGHRFFHEKFSDVRNILEKVGK